MRSCPFCQAKNRDEDSLCNNCGSALHYVTAPVDASPTQPTRLYGQPYVQPAYQGQPPYNNQPSYRQPVAPPPAPTGHQLPAWSLLIAGLSLLLLIACGLAVITMIITTSNGVAGIGAQLSTQVGQVIGDAGSDTPAPMATAPKVTPSPWPTFTPTPTVPPQRTVTPTPTQPSITNQLLSAECKGSLDQLSKVSDQVRNDPLKVLNETWRKDVDQATANMITYCGSLDSASPIPGELGQVQELVHQTTSAFDQAKLLWNQAVDQRDPAKAVSAAQHVGEAMNYLGQAISQLQKLVP